MSIRFAPAVAALSIALAPTAAIAQQERMSSQPNYTLVQVSVPAAEIAPQEFQARTAAIRSCGEAVELGKALDAKVTRSTFVHASELPPQLRPMLRELPNGTATPVLSEDGSALHVLVICNRA